MYALKLLLVAAMVLSCDAGKKKKKNKKLKKKLTYRAIGTSVPNESDGCYPGTLFDKKGIKEVGAFSDCVTSDTTFNDDGTFTFTVVTTFTPKKPKKGEPEEIVTTCDITVTPTEDIEPFNVIEKCKNKQGIVSPTGLKGVVKLNGKANNTEFPTLSYDLLWTIKYSGKPDKS